MVTSVKQAFERRRSFMQDGRITHTLVYKVMTDDPADGTAVAMFATDGTTVVPRPGSTYRGLPLSRVDVEPVNGTATAFEVLCEFTAPDATANDDPLNRPW